MDSTTALATAIMLRSLTPHAGQAPAGQPDEDDTETEIPARLDHRAFAHHHRGAVGRRRGWSPEVYRAVTADSTKTPSGTDRSDDGATDLERLRQLSAAALDRFDR